MLRNLTTLEGKTIRDPVHGDILIHDKFVKLIDTPEFQRLRRIRQLSTADLLFPSAIHTRFSHSIGTYHIMGIIICHFEKILNDMNIEIEARERELALAAALLHDIGHGPFSHGFEGIIPGIEFKRHEKWTTEIILSKDTIINNTLIEVFDKNFPEDVVSLINKGFNNKNPNHLLIDIDLSGIISSLISSQLDADRMDYLLRDAFHTGVSYGKFDLFRLISSLRINIDKLDDNKYYLCVLEKYKSTIEEYLISRYQMHKEIYYHEFKVEMEEVLNKIIKRAYQLYKENKLNKAILPNAFISAFSGDDMLVKDYLLLDDISILSLIKKWKSSSDKVLSTLSSNFLDRKKLKRINILDNSPIAVKEFKTRLINILVNFGYKMDNLEQEYFWIEKTIESKKIYKKDEEIIWILKNDGFMVNFNEVTDILNGRKYKTVEKEIKGNDDNKIFFINLDMVKNIVNNEAVREIERLIKMYNIRNHIEIEKKYKAESQEVFDKALIVLTNWNKEYEIERFSSSVFQEDFYYDTVDNKLYSKQISLRVRHKNNKHILTIKTPTKESNDRFEYEKEISDEEFIIINHQNFIRRYIPELSNDDIANLVKKIVIKNNRQKVNIKKKKVFFEMVFDNVTYYNTNNKKKFHEFQLEIELKSDYPHRINLNQLANYLESKVTALEKITESKFIRAIKFTKD